MNKQTFRKLGLLLVVILFSLFLISLGYASVVGRWGAFRAFEYLIFAIGVWLVWFSILILVVVMWTPTSRVWIYRSLCFFGALLASFVAASFVIRIGGLVRAHEIQKAVNAGLYEDCQRLLANWPTNKELIEYDASEFAKLPTSIQMLNPVYLENDNIEDTDLPPNIGICRNGFGGFHMGVCVFRNDQDANEFARKTIGECKRIAPGVYYWWHPT